MEMTWEKPNSSSRGHHRQPSFSSTLLDQICRSIDDPPPIDNHHHHHHHRQSSFYDEDDYHRRTITAEIERSKRATTTDSFTFSSSDSIGFSKTSASPPPPVRPIRTSVEQKPTPTTKKQDLGGFMRKNSKALKIYTDLKKAKQPISPGGKLAAFLNSLFTATASATNPKKHKKTTTTHATEPYYSSSSSSCCSSASSFSRSCFSKTPSSSSSEIRSKRSVRFCTVNVILEEEGYGRNKDGKRHRQVMEEENRRVMEAAKDLLRTYHIKNKDHLSMTTSRNNNVQEEEEDDEEDDLFELENLSAIGEELPVYGTTLVDMNRAIASRFIV